MSSSCVASIEASSLPRPPRQWEDLDELDGDDHLSQSDDSRSDVCVVDEALGYFWLEIGDTYEAGTPQATSCAPRLAYRSFLSARVAGGCVRGAARAEGLGILGEVASCLDASS